MPSSKTETTELMVAFGMLGENDPAGMSQVDIDRKLEGTLSAEKFNALKDELASGNNRRLYNRMLNVGLQLRETQAYLRTLEILRWTGPDRMAATATVSRDIQAGFLSISVKAVSDNVDNGSPHNVFVALPRGDVRAARSPDWYLEVAPNEMQNLYAASKAMVNLEWLPDTVQELYQSSTTTQRKSELRPLLAEADVENDERFQIPYRELARVVSENSAARFNENMTASLAGRTRTAILENFARKMFRIDTTAYILAGIDRREEFAVKIPDITEWRRDWEFVSIQARPDLEAGQPQCHIDVEYRNKDTRETGSLVFRVEIRWSHGKFCGNPEGKLYKTFAWYELPFFERLF